MKHRFLDIIRNIQKIRRAEVIQTIYILSILFYLFLQTGVGHWLLITSITLVFIEVIKYNCRSISFFNFHITVLAVIAYTIASSSTILWHSYLTDEPTSAAIYILFVIVSGICAILSLYFVSKPLIYESATL